VWQCGSIAQGGFDTHSLRELDAVRHTRQFKSPIINQPAGECHQTSGGIEGLETPLIEDEQLHAHDENVPTGGGAERRPA